MIDRDGREQKATKRRRLDQRQGDSFLDFNRPVDEMAGVRGPPHDLFVEQRKHRGNRAARKTTRRSEFEPRSMTPMRLGRRKRIGDSKHALSAQQAFGCPAPQRLARARTSLGFRHEVSMRRKKPFFIGRPHARSHP